MFLVFSLWHFFFFFLSMFYRRSLLSSSSGMMPRRSLLATTGLQRLMYHAFRSQWRFQSVEVLPVNTLEERMTLQSFVVSSTSKWSGTQSPRRFFEEEVLYQVSRHWIKVIRELVVNIDDLLKRLPLLARFEWKISADHLINYNSERPKISPGRTHALFQHLRAHIQRCPAKGPLLLNKVRNILVHSERGSFLKLDGVAEVTLKS